MNYVRTYNDLIEKRKVCPAKGYVENHHIVPRSLGGSNKKDNLVTLTAREHWIAHLLLWKIRPCIQTAHACHMMAMNKDKRGVPKIRNSRMYELVRKECMRFCSENGKKRISELNGSFGTKWISSLVLKENRKIKNGDVVPDGWSEGRSAWLKERRVKEKKIKQERDKKSKEQRAQEIFRDFCKKKLSLRDYARLHYPFSHVSLHLLFKKYASKD